MKQLICKSALLVISFSVLVGCETNTRNENTTIGAVSGAVVGGLAGSAIGAGTGQAVAIGVGALAGAIVGGVIGNAMESSDSEKVVYVMENNPPHKATHWKNKKTGKHYTLTPTSKDIIVKGNHHCRNYQIIMYSNGKKREATGIACRLAKSWKAMPTA